MTEIRLYDGPEDEAFQPNPDDYEEHTLIGDSIRGVAGQTVMIHKNDLAILRKNKLIAPLESEQEQEQEQEQGTSATTKRKGGKAQPKAEIAPEPEKAEIAPEPEKAEAVADLPAVPNIADLPGV